MTKIPVTTLASLLSLGELAFTYITKDGDTKTTRGKDGKLSANGNVTYYDLSENDYRTVHANSIVSALLSKTDPNWQIPKKSSGTSINTGTSISTATLQDLLENNIVKFEYAKGDGTLRVAYGTTDNKRIQKAFINNSNNSLVVNYFDIEKQGIRSVSKGVYVKLITMFDLPLKK
jgi:hypothetical protein